MARKTHFMRPKNARVNLIKWQSSNEIIGNLLNSIPKFDSIKCTNTTSAPAGAEERNPDSTRPNTNWWHYVDIVTWLNYIVEGAQTNKQHFNAFNSSVDIDNDVVTTIKHILITNETQIDNELPDSARQVDSDVSVLLRFFLSFLLSLSPAYSLLSISPSSIRNGRHVVDNEHQSVDSFLLFPHKIYLLRKWPNLF